MSILTRQSKVLGVLFLALVVLATYLVYATFTKKFADYDRVNVETSEIGLQLPNRADVKIRGVIVGEVLDMSATADGAELTKISAMAKLYCTDVAMEVTTDAVQVLGGYGYIQEYPVERMMRDAKITQIYEGTNQIQRIVIAREMLKENRAFLLAGVG